MIPGNQGRVLDVKVGSGKRSEIRISALSERKISRLVGGEVLSASGLVETRDNPRVQ